MKRKQKYDIIKVYTPYGMQYAVTRRILFGLFNYMLEAFETKDDAKEYLKILCDK